MGIVDLHFHDSEFTAVKRPGSQGEKGTGGAEESDSGRCLGCLAVTALVVAGVVGVVAFLLKRKLGGGSEETTLSEFSDENDDADVA